MNPTIQKTRPNHLPSSGFYSLGQAAAPLYQIAQPQTSKNGARKFNLPSVTDFSPIRGANVLFVLDDDNFRIGMRKGHGLHFCEHSLRRKIEAEARNVRPVAAYCSTARDARQAFFERDGWEVVAVPQESVHTFSGKVMKGNIDHCLCVEIGMRAASSGGMRRTDTTLIGSGDGDLCVAIARTLKRHFPKHRVITLSVPGCTSHRLTSTTRIFDGHIDVGLDLAVEFQTKWS